MKETVASWFLRALRYQSIPSVLPWAFRQIRNLFRGQPERYFRFLVNQADDHSSWLPAFFAAHQIHHVWFVDPERAHELLLDLSAHSEEIVREGAARSWSRRLKEDFEPVFTELKDLSRSDTYELRYTAALAPVLLLDEDLDPGRVNRLRTFWLTYRNDERQGLWNLVRQQILQKHGLLDPDDSSSNDPSRDGS